jgi:GntR family transcriptional regulator
MINLMQSTKIDALEHPSVTTTPKFSPLYQQIKGLLTASLKEGAWRPGEVIPSEVELARRFSVSQGTVRKAIDELAAENVLVRRQGRGTYVATHHEPKAQFRFLRLRANEGATGAPKSTIIDCKRVRTPAEVAKQLGLKPSDSCLLIRRILEFDGLPQVLDEIWLGAAQFRGLTAERVEQFHGPLYGLFESEFGLRMIRAQERISAIKVGKAEAALLQISEDSPILLVDRTSYTYQGVAVEFRRGYYRTESFHYFNELI